MATNHPILVAEGVSRRFGYRRVIDDVSLTLHRGDVVVLIGPNGAGKTTLLHVLAGLIRPTTGRVDRHGTVGMVAHHSMLYDALTAAENLEFAARLMGLSDASRTLQVLERVGLSRWRHDRVATFSRGMIQRLTVARALIADPDLLLLDEPLSSLDEMGAEMMLDLLANFGRSDRAVLMVTHQYARVQSVATGVGFLIGGAFREMQAAAGTSAESIGSAYQELLTHA